MDLMTLLRQAFIGGYTTGNIDMQTILVCTVLATIFGLYIFIVYKCVNRNAFYNRGFSLSLIAISVITAAIILTIQSNIVVSLGMVGALSIVRFRTAIKDPMDLVFLFWSISAGIICGAGYSMIAVVASIVITIVIVLLSIFPGERDSKILVVNSPSYDCEERVMQIVKSNCGQARVRARNVSQSSLNLAIEVKTHHERQLIRALMESSSVTSASIVEHDGDITP